MIAWLASALDPEATALRREQLERGAQLFLGLLALHALLVPAATAWARRQGRTVAALWTPPPAPEGDLAPRTAGLVAAGILAAGALARTIGLGQDLWMDEVFTLTEFVRLPARLIVSSFPHDNQHLLYSLLARGSVSLLGESAPALRLPSVVLGVASLAAVARLGALVLGRREGLLAAALLAVSYHHVWFSQNARGYTGLLLATVLSTDLFLRGLWRGRIATWLAYAATVALGAWLHLTMVFVPAAHALGLAACVVVRARALPSGDTAARRALGAAAVRAAAALALAASGTLLLYALVLPQMLAFFTRPGGGSTTHPVEWKNPLWLLNETLRGLGLGLALGWLGLAAGLVLFAAGALALLRRDPLFAALCALPAALGGAALLALGRNLWPRFFFHEAGFAALGAVAGAVALAGLLAPHLGAARARALGRLLAVLLVAASAAGLPRAWRVPKQDYRGPVALIRSEATPEDRVIALDVAGEVYRRYYAPEWTFAKDAAALAAAESRAGRTWVVYTLPRYLAATQPDLARVLDAEYELVREFPGSVGDGVLVVRWRAPRRGPDAQGLGDAADGR